MFVAVCVMLIGVVVSMVVMLFVVAVLAALVTSFVGVLLLFCYDVGVFVFVLNVLGAVVVLL